MKGQCLAQGASQGGHSHRAMQCDLPASCLPPITSVGPKLAQSKPRNGFIFTFPWALPSHFSPGSLDLTTFLFGKLLAVFLGLPGFTLWALSLAFLGTELLLPSLRCFPWLQLSWASSGRLLLPWLPSPQLLWVSQGETVPIKHVPAGSSALGEGRGLMSRSLWHNSHADTRSGTSHQSRLPADPTALVQEQER